MYNVANDGSDFDKHHLMDYFEANPSWKHANHLDRLASYGNDEHRQRVLDHVIKHIHKYGYDILRDVKYKLIEKGSKAMRESLRDDPDEKIRNYVKFPPRGVRDD